ncbi:uncharacterized protein L201_000405 [Kwoniella dendrophila CBS 6074]|uniref:O-methyltransferase n=1 Tax=Kwoniella dendrophila CBS 6074 TaxID=1295534 RepID=A0AAX4JJD9_9TREE
MSSSHLQLTSNPIVAPQHVHDLLGKLHQLSLDQEKDISAQRLRQKAGFDDLMRNKFIALDQDKCWFVYQTCLSIKAKNVIEAGTSYGVSTIYLSLAVNQSLKLQGLQSTKENGKVIATENEPEKMEQSQKYWKECGEEVSDLIELRKGDLRETLSKDLPEKVDSLLLDIWSPLALPTLKIVQPNLRPGSVVITDNIVGSADRYKDLIEYLNDDNNGFRNITIPYDKGLGVSVYLGKQ